MSDASLIAAKEALARVPLSPFVPARPTGKQMAFLANMGREALYGGTTRSLDIDTPIPTPEGWTKMGQIEVGDIVLGMRGQPVVVDGVSEIAEHDAWEFEFDDGTTVVSHAGHRWIGYNQADWQHLLKGDPAKRAKRRSVRPSRSTGKRPDLAARNTATATPQRDWPTPYTVTTTADIVAAFRPGSARSVFAVPVAGSFDRPDVDLPIPPYTLGAWLGDGNTRDGSITSMDREVITGVEADGFETRVCPATVAHTAPLYRVVGLTTTLKAVGLAGFKHIPSSYLRASRQQRMALLRGLMDTDGSQRKGTNGCTFTTTKQRLADDVAELIRSLGWKVSVVEKRAWLYGKDCGPQWMFNFCPDEPVFTIARKLRPIEGWSRRNGFKFIRDVRPVGKRFVKCISVDDPDSAFVAGEGWVVTGNSMKSWAALMAALQFVCVPGYSAIIYRRERASLKLPGGLIPISQSWLANKAKWSGDDFQWTFPSGATLNFGYISNPDDLIKYQSTAYQFILFEEVAEFPTDTEWRFMFSRCTPHLDPNGVLPKCKCHGWSLADVPLRMRATANPGGPGQAWVRQNFIIPHRNGVQGIFHPASYKDNPFIDQSEYEQMVSKMKAIDRARALGGDWDITAPGERFSRDWFMNHGGETRVIDPNAKGGHWREIAPTLSLVRRWDLATTKPNVNNRDPDWTVGALVGHRKWNGEDQWYIIDIARFRATSGERNAKMRKIAERDSKRYKRQVPIRVEREPGALARTALKMMKSLYFSGLNFRGVPSKVRKEDRIDQLAAAAEDGEVWIVMGEWVEPFLDEADAFGHPGVHDDQLDAVAGGMSDLGRGGSAKSSGRQQREIDDNAEPSEGEQSMAYPSNDEISTRVKSSVGGFAEFGNDEASMSDIYASFDGSTF